MIGLGMAGNTLLTRGIRVIMCKAWKCGENQKRYCMLHTNCMFVLNICTFSQKSYIVNPFRTRVTASKPIVFVAQKDFS
jgi:hypothetical protein